MQTVRFIGLDVHKDSIAIAFADSSGSEPALVATVPNDTLALIKRLQKLGRGRRLLCCYEAGPTGYGLCRDLNEANIECRVVAPSLVPVQVGSRIKTDRRDAAKLARFLRSGDLTQVTVPDPATEAMRDLERAREDAKRAERTARHHLAKFLLRCGRIYPGKTSWSVKHLDWVRQQRFGHQAQQRVLADYLHAVEESSARVQRLTDDIRELVETWSRKPLVDALQALRGIQLVTAVIIAAELGDIRRFKTAPQLMGYLGLVPSEHSSGNSKRRGSITKTGNGHVRRILTESAWAYRFRPAMSRAIRQRSRAASPEVLSIAWKAQERLHRRYSRLTGRGMTRQKVITAIARELAGFIWAVGQQKHLVA